MSNLRGPSVPAFLRNLPPSPNAAAPSTVAPSQLVTSAVVGPDGIEQYTQAIPIPLGRNAGVPAEVSLCTTVRRWKAIDVYVHPSPSLPATVQGIISIFVYALMGGVRSLVASGRVVLDVGPTAVSLFANLGANAPRWVAGARDVSAQYEVCYSVAAPGAPPDGNPQPGGFTISVAASDRSDAVPESVGAVTWTNAAGDYGILNAARPGLHRCELIGLSASLGLAVAAPRWIHVHDFAAPVAAIPANTVPALSIPVGATYALGGMGVVDRLVRFRAQGFLTIVASSVQATSTAVNDTQASYTIR